MAVYTKIFKNQNKEYIESLYSFKINKISKIKAGILNTNFLIESQNKKKYILRIFEANRSKEEEEEELNFLYKISNFVPISLPIKNIENEFISEIDNKKICLFKYIEGEILNETNAVFLEQIAEYLAKIHNFSSIIKKENFRRKSRIDFNFYFEKIKKNLNSKKENEILNLINKKTKNKTLIEMAEEIQKVNFDSLPSGVIHSDIFQDNVIIKNNKIVAILDFNEACYAPFIYDIATVINFWIKNKKFDKLTEDKFIKIFISSYEKYRKLEKKELDFLENACKKIILLFIFLRFYKENVEKIYQKNIVIEKKSYKNLFQLIEEEIE